MRAEACSTPRRRVTLSNVPRSDRAHEDRVRQNRAPKPGMTRPLGRVRVEPALRQADGTATVARARESRGEIARVPIVEIDRERDFRVPSQSRARRWLIYPKEASSKA